MRVVDAPDSFTEVIEDSANLGLGSQSGKLLLCLFTERIYLRGIDTDLVKEQSVLFRVAGLGEILTKNCRVAGVVVRFAFGRW